MSIQDLSPKVHNLSLPAAIQRRETLKAQLNSSLLDLNKNLEQQKIPVKTLRKIVGDLQETNAVIEQRKDQLQNKKCCNCLSQKRLQVTSIIILGITFIAWFINGALSVYKVATSNDNSDQGRDIADVAISVSALFLTTVVGAILKEIDGNRSQLEMLSKISHLEKQGEDQFQEFLKALKDFKKYKEKDQLSRCIHTLDQLSGDNLCTQIPSKEHWISLFVTMLPENHPIKTRFQALKTEALKILNVQEEGGKLIYAEPSDDSSETPPPKMLRKDLVSKTDSSSGEEKFGGEKMAFKSLNLQSTPHTVKKESERVLNQDQIEEYKKDWKALEAELGFSIKCVQIQNHCIDGACRVFNRIEDHPVYKKHSVRDVRKKTNEILGSEETV